MRHFTKREQNIFIICILVIFSFITYNGFIKPLKGKINLIKGDIESAKIDIHKYNRVLGRSKSVEAKYSRFLGDFKQNVSNEQVMSALLSEIGVVAGKLNLRISDKKPKKVKEHDYYNHFSVSLTIDSKLVEVVHFLYILQNQPHLFDVEEIRFDKSSRRKDKTLKTRLVLSKILIK